MSHTLALSEKKRWDPIFLWILIAWMAFILMPSWSLDYGLFDSTA
ncbi:hypothetical protein QP468_21820, partial [Proteus mirabilis]|nr:hypothetical protein [Proteus mirabilis]